MTTILFAGGGTGGHLMPALAIAAATQAHHPGWRCVLVGAERGVEATMLPQRGVPHYLLPLEPLYRQEWWKNLRWPFLLPRLIRGVDGVLDAESPAVVVGTGGYVSGPVLWRAVRRGIPAGVLELDVHAGFATRRLASMVNEIWLAAPETLDALPRSVRARATVTGAPIVPPDPSRRTAARARFGLTDGLPTVVITGGSQGSLAINRLVAEWIGSGGNTDAQIIWSTGRGTYAQFAALDSPPRVQVLPFIDPMADAWAVADVVVARAGMMTLAELCAWGIPSVLVPLPTAAADHQTSNARAMAAAGAARLLVQDGLTAPQLGGALDDMLSDAPARAKMSAAAQERGRPQAAAAIAEAVGGLAQLNPSRVVLHGE